MEAAIEAEGICKKYDDTEVLSGIDLSVPTGSVLGLLGPNGAGKTTMVRILATLLPPDAGRARVAGYDVQTNAQDVRKRIGLAGQYAAVDERLTGRENLVLIGKLHQLGSKESKRRAVDMLERFDLTGAADRATKTYSGGMRRRLDLAASLLANPGVLFLDEPTTGLDLTSRLTLWAMVREQVSAGVTVLLTTQYLEEADQLADRIAVLDKGQVIADGTPTELKRKVGGEWLEVSVATADSVAEVSRLMEQVATGAPVVGDQGLSVSVPVRSGIDAIAEAATALRGGGIEVVDFAMRRPSLDDVFLALTGRRTSPEDKTEDGDKKADKNKNEAA